MSTETTSTRFPCLNIFWLRIIAIITMTIDHIGAGLQAYYNYSISIANVALVFRYIGRLALPLFCFLIVEGVLHTKNYKKYALRIGVLALIIIVAFIVCTYAPGLGLQTIALQGNIYLDLLFGSLVVYLLNQKHSNWLKILIVIPLGISVISFFAKTQVNFSWYPQWLLFQYDWFSLAMILCFYLAYKAADLFFSYRSKYTGLSSEDMKETSMWRITVNLFAILGLVVVNILYYLIRYMGPSYVYWQPNVQLFAIVSGIFILGYNGALGYHKKWFSIFSYLYYPVSVILTFAIIYLTTLV